MNTELVVNKEKCNNILTTFCLQNRTYMYMYTRASAHTLYSISHVSFDLKSRNYSMTCFMFVYKRLRNTDVKIDEHSNNDNCYSRIHLSIK